MDKWDLSRIYKDTASFEADLKRVKDEFIPKMASYEGKLSTHKSLHEYLALDRELEGLFNKLFIYCSCLSDLDKKNVANAALLSKAEIVAQELGRKTSFQNPEILKIGEEGIKKFFEEYPSDKDYDFSFEKLFRDSSHILNEREEKLLSAYSPLLNKGDDLYSQLTVGDYTPKKAKLSDGSEVEVNLSNWTSLIEKTKKAEDRAAIFQCLYSYYDEHKNVYGEIYNTTLQGELATMRSRGYSSILEEHLYGNNIPTSVFHNLIEVASKESAPLHKYYEIRRKYLGLEKHRSYDRFLQLAHSDKKYTYQEAKDLFFASVSSFPSDFQAKAHEVLKEGYVDVYPGSGKRTGAYSTGGVNIHPYILFNYIGNLDDCFTVAHESGHSIHTLYSEENQPLIKQDYTIFVAEIASTFNEHNLLDYLLENGKMDKEEKICLLQKAIDEIVGTFYRQTLFANYEYDISVMAQKGEPINYEVLSSEMIKLYKTYYGIDITEEKVKPLVWAYIPHLFYTPFYVYQYATSFTASMLIYENVKKKVPGAFDKYIGLLKSGGSDYPINEVKAAGVDLTSKEPFLAVTKRMAELVDELEKTLKE
jgi:oligoendopeptidase F